MHKLWFTRGDRIEYLVHANEDSANEQVIGPFSFLVISWSTVTGVTGYTDNGSSVDVHVGDSAGSFSPVIRFAFPTDDGFHLQLAERRRADDRRAVPLHRHRQPGHPDDRDRRTGAEDPEIAPIVSQSTRGMGRR